MALLKLNGKAERVAGEPTLDINIMYTSAMQTAQFAITQTALYAPTVTPTITSTPTHTPTFVLTYTSAPLESNSAQKEVEDFIYWYWELVSKKDFETAWKYQSANFQRSVLQDKLDNFSNGFKYTKKVKVIWVRAVSIDNYRAVVDADLQFIATDGTILNASHRYVLIKQDGRWLLDSAEKR